MSNFQHRNQSPRKNWAKSFGRLKNQRNGHMQSCHQFSVALLPPTDNEFISVKYFVSYDFSNHFHGEDKKGSGRLGDLGGGMESVVSSSPLKKELFISFQCPLRKVWMALHWRQGAHTTTVCKYVYEVEWWFFFFLPGNTLWWWQRASERNWLGPGLPPPCLPRRPQGRLPFRRPLCPRSPRGPSTPKPQHGLLCPDEDRTEVHTEFKNTLPSSMYWAAWSELQGRLTSMDLRRHHAVCAAM